MAADRETEWEYEIKLRRNGRMVKRFNALGDSAGTALWATSTDAELWADDEEWQVKARESCGPVLAALRSVGAA